MKTLIIATLLLVSAIARAQQNTDSSPNLAKKVLHHLVSSASVESNFYRLEQGGQDKSKSYSIGIGIDGQIFETDEDDLIEIQNLKVLPYEIKITNDGRRFIKVSAGQFTALYDEDAEGVLQGGVLTFEYKKDYDYIDQIDAYMNVLMLELKHNLIGDKDDRFKIQGTAGANVGLTNRLETPEIKLPGYFGPGAGVNYGVNMTQSLSPTTSISAGITGTNSVKKYLEYVSPEVDARRDKEKAEYLEAHYAATAAQQQWDKDKYQWEVDHGYSAPMQTEYYLSASGASPRPAKASGEKNFDNDNFWKQSVIRKTFILNPSVTFSKTLLSGNELKVNVNANLVIKDKLVGKNITTSRNASGIHVNNNELVKYDLKQSLSQSRVNLSLTFVFGRKFKRDL